MNKAVVLGSLWGLGIALGLALSAFAPVPETTQNIEWLESPRNLEAFHLVSESGKFDNESLVGSWTIVTFGFLNCPDICPTSLAQMSQLSRSLADQQKAQQLTYVFVSIDPGRDSVTAVSEYARQFDSSILGVTGAIDDLLRFASSLGVQFKVISDPDNYSVAHSITYSIIDPNGVLRGRFRPGFDASILANQLRGQFQVPG